MDIPRHWRLKAQRYRLQGSRCPMCGQPSFPPRPMYPRRLAQITNVADRRGSLTANSIAIPDFTPHIDHQVADATTGRMR